MTSEIDEFRTSLVAAVQAELERHASAVVAEVDRIREDGERDRAELRAEFTDQIGQIVDALEAVQARSESTSDKTREALEKRIDESESRQTRRLDDVAGGLEDLVAAAARPVLADVKDEQDAMSRRIESLDTNLRKFDEQAARMVTYFNDVSEKMEERQDELTETLKTDVATQLEGLKRLVDDNDSAIRKFQGEVGKSVTQKLNDAEDRFNNRLLAAESRMKEENGQKIAEIDLHVSRVSSGLDETMQVLNDRIAKLDDRFTEIDRRIDELEESVKQVDREEIEELKERLSTAAGEAMLVRIEMERLEKSVNEKSDGMAVRITEVEQALADATMDVSTAVQLDRLEEIERAILEMPNQFVQKGESIGAGGAGGATASGDGADVSLKNGDGAADATPEIDYSAIVSADESRHDQQADT